jgi:hypothetical protein
VEFGNLGYCFFTKCCKDTLLAIFYPLEVVVQVTVAIGEYCDKIWCFVPIHRQMISTKRKNNEGQNLYKVSIFVQESSFFHYYGNSGGSYCSETSGIIIGMFNNRLHSTAEQALLLDLIPDVKMSGNLCNISD